MMTTEQLRLIIVELQSHVIGKLESHQIIEMEEGRYVVFFQGRWWDMTEVPNMHTKTLTCSDCPSPCGREWATTELETTS